MRFLRVALKLKIKELLSNRSYIIVLILLPLLIGSIGVQGVKWMGATSLRAGLYFEEVTTLGLAMEEILLKDESIQFEVYDDLKELEKAVAKGEIECGFSVSRHLDEVMEEDLDGVITLLMSPATIASGVIQETVGAAFYRVTTSDIAFASLKNKEYMQQVTELKSKVKEQVESYYRGGDLMQVKIVTGNEEKANHQNNRLASVLQLGKGFIAVFLFISSLLVGVKLTEERNSECYKRFYTFRKKIKSPELPLILSHFIVQFLVGALSLIVMKAVIYQYIEVNLLKEMMHLVLYIISLNAFILCISLIIRESHIWFGITPILGIACVIFCPIVIDFSSMQTPLKYICYFFIPYYYLKGKLGVLIGIEAISLVSYMIIKKSCRGL